MKWLVGVLDADKNGKVNLDDAYAKFGVAVTRAALIALGIGGILGFLARGLGCK